MDRRTVLKTTGAVAGGVGVAIGAYYLEPFSDDESELDGIDRENSYIVSPVGDDDNPGTERNPFATLERAIEAVEPGESIILRGGVYERVSRIEIEGLAGTAENRITIAGYAEENPVFRFDGPTPGGWDADGGLEFSDVQYLTVRNITVENSPHLGIYVRSQSSNNRFEEISTLDNNLAGIGLHEGSSNNLVRNVTSANNYDPQNEGQEADGIQLSHTENNEVIGGEFYNNADDGLDLWGSTSITVERCKSWNNGRGENGNGNGFKLGGDEASGDHRIVRNIAFSNRNIGFTYNEATMPITLYNNTSCNNQYDYSFYDVEHRLVNNISYEGEVALGPSIRDEHNTWNLDIDDPEFKSEQRNDEHFLRLSAESPCIDAGREVDIEYTGEAPDLGAYEYGK